MANQAQRDANDAADRAQRARRARWVVETVTRYLDGRPDAWRMDCLSQHAAMRVAARLRRARVSGRVCRDTRGDGYRVEGAVLVTFK